MRFFLATFIFTLITIGGILVAEATEPKLRVIEVRAPSFLAPGSEGEIEITVKNEGGSGKGYLTVDMSDHVEETTCHTTEKNNRVIFDEEFEIASGEEKNFRVKIRMPTEFKELVKQGDSAGLTIGARTGKVYCKIWLPFFKVCLQTGREEQDIEPKFINAHHIPFGEITFFEVPEIVRPNEKFKVRVGVRIYELPKRCVWTTGNPWKVDIAEIKVDVGWFGTRPTKTLEKKIGDQVVELEVGGLSPDFLEEDGKVTITARLLFRYFSEQPMSILDEKEETFTFIHKPREIKLYLDKVSWSEYSGGCVYLYVKTIPQYPYSDGKFYLYIDGEQVKEVSKAFNVWLKRTDVFYCGLKEGEHKAYVKDKYGVRSNELNFFIEQTEETPTTTPPETTTTLPETTTTIPEENLTQEAVEGIYDFISISSPLICDVILTSDSTICVNENGACPLTMESSDICDRSIELSISGEWCILRGKDSQVRTLIKECRIGETSITTTTTLPWISGKCKYADRDNNLYMETCIDSNGEHVDKCEGNKRIIWRCNEAKNECEAITKICEMRCVTLANGMPICEEEVLHLPT